MKGVYNFSYKVLNDFREFFNLKAIKLRPFNQYLKQKFNDKAIKGIEIGVFKGNNALEILNHVNISKLYLIDPFETHSKYNNWDDYEGLVRKKLSSFSNFYKLFVDFSYNVVNVFDDNSLDFVYIDGDHCYEAVKKDIKLFYPKIKEGGIIGGHDYTPRYPGVARAVLEFQDEMSIQVRGVKNDFWFEKKL